MSQLRGVGSGEWGVGGGGDGDVIDDSPLLSPSSHVGKGVGEQKRQ